MSARAGGLCAAVFWPLLAAAHAHLELAQPADGSVVTATPSRLLLQFSESAQLTSVTLRRQGVAQAQHIGPLPAATSAQFSLSLPPLDPGVYELRYRVLSSDSHIVAGSIHFTVAMP